MVFLDGGNSLAYFILMRSLRPRVNPRKTRTASPFQKSLYVSAMFNKANGYGELSRQFCVHAAKRVDLGILPHGDYAAQLRDLGLAHALGSNPVKPNSLFSIQPTFSLMQAGWGNRNGILTMFETSKLNSAWCRAINSFDVLITPSHANAVDFAEQLRIPVEVCNLGHDENLFNLQPYNQSGPFVFGAAAHVGHGRTRKGIERIIDWFESAFPNEKNVRLSLKLNEFPENGIIPKDSRISIIENDVTDLECKEWLTSLHCYIDGSTFEGWGMWNHHSMATGRPVIGTNYSARCEYFKFGNHIPIGYRVVEASDQYKGLGHWAMPDRSDAIEAMRWAFNNPDKCEIIGLTAYNSIKYLTWERFTNRVLFLLRKHQIASY